MTNERMLVLLKQYTSGKITEISAIITELEDDIRKEINRKHGVKMTIENIIKGLIKENNSTNYKILNGYIKFNNKYIFMDYKQMYILNNDLGYEKSQSTIDIQRIFPSNEMLHHGEVVKVDKKELEFLIKTKEKTILLKSDKYEVLSDLKMLFNALIYFKTDEVKLLGENKFIIGDIQNEAAFMLGYRR